MEEEKDKNTDNWSYIASKWKKSVLSLKEYLLTDKEEKPSEFSYASLHLAYGDYSRANQLRERLLHQYQGKNCEDLFPGQICKNDYGQCYHIEHRMPLVPSSWNGKEKTDLLSHLELIPGIGSITRQKLQLEGYQSIEDLCRHPRFQPSAQRFLDAYRQSSLEDLSQWMEHRLRRSHPAWVKLLSLTAPEDWAFMDIETLGLFARPVILIGLGMIEGQELVIHQWLVRQIEEEASALMEYYRLVQRARILITYNGQRFDIPYLQDRWSYYGIQAPLKLLSLDMLYPSRSLWKNTLPNCKLQTLESALLKKERCDDVPGAMVPEFYHAYLESCNPGPLVPIITHNQTDIASLAELSFKLYAQ